MTGNGTGQGLNLGLSVSFLGQLLAVRHQQVPHRPRAGGSPVSSVRAQEGQRFREEGSFFDGRLGAPPRLVVISRHPEPPCEAAGMPKART